jgi:hypothetical protein
MSNVMDNGAVVLGFTMGVLTELTSTARMYVDVPKSYRPDLGDNYRCQLFDPEGAFLEELYCDMQWDWSLKVWGPRTATVSSPTDAPVEYMLKVLGVQFSTSNTNNW